MRASPLASAASSAFSTALPVASILASEVPCPKAAAASATDAMGWSKATTAALPGCSSVSRFLPSVPLVSASFASCDARESGCTQQVSLVPEKPQTCKKGLMHAFVNDYDGHADRLD